MEKIASLATDIGGCKLDLDLAGYVRKFNQELVGVDTMALFISIAVLNRNLESPAGGKV